jgi:hypothetical protein
MTEILATASMTLDPKSEALRAICGQLRTGRAAQYPDLNMQGRWRYWA